MILHGMGRKPASMSKLSDALREEGWYTVNQGYPSTKLTIEEISAVHVPRAIAACPPERRARIHFVTHSLGGIVVRHYLQTNSVPAGSRVVMLAPPNHGSEIVHTIGAMSSYRWATGPAGQQLVTGEKGILDRLGPIDVEVGIIAGNRSYEPWFSHLFPGENDGKVTVQSTKLDEMTDFLVVNEGHTFIMRDPVVIDQVASFLESGRFIHDEASVGNESSM